MLLAGWLCQVLTNVQAVLPESRGFAWRLTGRQNLEFYALLYGLSGIDAKDRINFLLEFTKLKERADDGYQRYSSGMQRKLLLCRALLRNTPILLFDEPTVGLDPASAAEFRSLLHEKLTREEGKTIFLSTHNLQEAQGLCDRIAILDRGKIIACDTPDNIRCTIFEDNVFKITFIDTDLDEKIEKIVKTVGEIPSVNDIAPEFDSEGKFLGIKLRVNKNMDLSNILEVIMKDGLKIKMISSEEPTLEDAFMVITGQQKERSDVYGSNRKGS